MEGRSGGVRNPVFSLLVGATLVAVAGIGVKAWLNEPERRAQEVCYPAYRAFTFFRVTLTRPVFPQEHAFILRGIDQGEQFYFGCVDTMNRLPGFEPNPLRQPR